jgi:hypothetical protein
VAFLHTTAATDPGTLKRTENGSQVADEAFPQLFQGETVLKFSPGFTAQHGSQVADEVFPQFFTGRHGSPKSRVQQAGRKRCADEKSQLFSPSRRFIYTPR